MNPAGWGWRQARDSPHPTPSLIWAHPPHRYVAPGLCILMSLMIPDPVASDLFIIFLGAEDLRLRLFPLNATISEAKGGGLGSLLEKCAPIFFSSTSDKPRDLLGPGCTALIPCCIAHVSPVCTAYARAVLQA